MPQLPARARPNWIFTQEEIDIARRRMPSETKVHTGLFKWRDIVRWHKTWHVWLCKLRTYCAQLTPVPLTFLFSAQLGQAGASSEL